MSGKEETYLYQVIAEANDRIGGRALDKAVVDAILADPNITITVPEPDWPFGTIGYGSDSRGTRRMGFVGLLSGRNRKVFWLLEEDGHNRWRDLPSVAFEPVIPFTREELRMMRSVLGGGKPTMGTSLFDQFLIDKGYPLDD